MFPLAHYNKVVNIRRFSLPHYKKVMNIRRFSLPYFKKVMNIRRFSLVHYQKVVNIRRFSLSLQKVVNIQSFSLSLLWASRAFWASSGSHEGEFVRAPASFRPRTGFWDTHANARRCSHSTPNQTCFPFPALPGSQKAPGAAEALRFLKNLGPNFWS